MEQQVSQGRELVYDAVLYGLGATLGELARTELGARFAEELHKSVGQHMAEYLESRGITYAPGASPEQSVRSILGVFLEQLDFAQLEKAEPTEQRGTHGVWRDILGLAAYAQLAQRYPDPFLSCPLNAVIRYELAKQGHTLQVHGCTADVAQNLLESWEAVVPGTHFLTGEAAAPARGGDGKGKQEQE
jgi:hypothetical protein